MGDVGALALGAALGIVAVMTRHEIVLFIMGGIFVLETVSVIIQVGVVQTDGKARLSDGADPSPFRAQGLARAARHCPFLDYYRDAGPVWARDAEATVIRCR